MKARKGDMEVYYCKVLVLYMKLHSTINRYNLKRLDCDKTYSINPKATTKEPQGL